ncbi:hypothetical protein A2963_00230 [Candidatus Roizmanbacteria bacterium RIFCSPLOWO2_01_FULL_40_13]|nr:MAG: hypothetical protein A2963_00230 [Candidatus Roizmanbacteria bacterium RIFCSPLOWO2_01_FULL_40_13]
MIKFKNLLVKITITFNFFPDPLLLFGLNTGAVRRTVLESPMLPLCKIFIHWYKQFNKSFFNCQ